MNYIIQKNTHIPAYQQLYRQVKENIIKGVFPFNTKLPSKRIMATEANVSTITVEHAYEQLCAEGYAEARERSGYFVLFRKNDGFITSIHHCVRTSELVTLSPTEQFPFSVVAKTMRRVLDDYGVAIMQKSPNAGCMELRNTIALYLARNRGISVGAEQIVIGSGAEYLYGLLVELLGRNLIYAIESPSYEKIVQVYRSSGVRCELLPLCNDGIDSDALSITQADVLHVTPYRSYPSGVTASASKRHEYIRWASEKRFIVEDDFESEFSVTSKPVETLFSMTDSNNVIYINTFSKTVSPAIRAGYMVLPNMLAKVFSEKLGFYSCTVPTFEQYVLAELIARGDFERHINRIRRRLRKTMKESF